MILKNVNEVLYLDVWYVRLLNKDKNLVFCFDASTDSFSKTPKVSFFPSEGKYPSQEVSHHDIILVLQKLQNNKTTFRDL